MGGLGENFSRWLDFPGDISHVLAFSFLFMFSMVSMNIIFRWFGRSSRETLSMRSRFVGGILGLAQGGVFVSLILLMFSIFDVPEKTEQESAVLYEPMSKLAPIVFDYTTAWMPGSKEFFEQIKSQFEGKF